jgi:hypothetical protein
MAGERFNREPAGPRLAEAPPADAELDTELDTSALLTRLEKQAAESGRLDGRVQTLERALKAERDARRRLGETLQRERKAAEALYERAEREREAHAAAAAEVERLRQVVATAEQQVQLTCTQLTHAEQQLAWNERSLWRKLLRKPPKYKSKS